MKTSLLFFLAGKIFFMLIAVPLVDSHGGQSEAWSESDWQWLNENFHIALDHKLPLDKSSDVIVSYRSYETLQVGDPEYSLTILWRRNNGSATHIAHIRMPDGTPIGRQMLLFHRKHPLSSVAEAEKALMFKDWELTEEKCPSLKASLQKVEQVRFGLPSDKIYMDPTVHEFHLNSNSGNIHAVLVDYENPLVQWGLETRHAMQACGAGNLPTAESASAPQE